MSTTNIPEINQIDRWYIDRMRGLSILRVVLMHLGLAWILTPYSQLLHAFLPVLFFVSGAVSYFSYLRSTSVLGFLKRRLATLLVPYYLITGILLVIYFIGDSDISLTARTFLEWLTLIPKTEDMPFPVGHIWFLHTLAIITLCAIPIFALAKRVRYSLLIVFFASITIPIVQTFIHIKPYLDIANHNLYQPLSCLSFFLLGGVFYSYRKTFNTRCCIALSVVLGSLATTLLLLLDLDINLASHSYSPNAYYLLASLTAIFLLISLQKPITAILMTAHSIDKFVMLFCTNAYAIYILHPVFISISEQWLGLEGVSGDIKATLMKISFVLIGTLVVSIPITRLTNIVIIAIKNITPANSDGSLFTKR